MLILKDCKSFNRRRRRKEEKRPHFHSDNTSHFHEVKIGILKVVFFSDIVHRGSLLACVVEVNPGHQALLLGDLQVVLHPLQRVVHLLCRRRLVSSRRGGMLLGSSNLNNEASGISALSVSRSTHAQIQ